MRGVSSSPVRCLVACLHAPSSAQQKAEEHRSWEDIKKTRTKDEKGDNTPTTRQEPLGDFSISVTWNESDILKWRRDI